MVKRRLYAVKKSSICNALFGVATLLFRLAHNQLGAQNPIGMLGTEEASVGLSANFGRNKWIWKGPA